ncbi:Rtc3p KNAG_0B04430 [Huiozyma naganishii CBS 8797]|uniref:Ribosome maturation protein SDO1/SBDS N-terminal domain-containing protein n=1 Tax=Huiozyma naganishii (strain ATCC MYA-139 / BCRC 22969 / CBS 8797 / KCTC 17520 / NBRC 10181 / NCYC 3082 / Yp74L-3) TaxID=1071383 RepID=J7RVD3_HUIN7|nr:hypothetical protein KNAG_0B04430 [Kazachstania naganishii CBS 8797]CCK68877.1 hypothetical protein KNAG_0B04430 [Kazachstania naganishii CBS 8797]
MSNTFKYFYQGKKTDFIVFVSSEEAVKNYVKNNETINLPEMTKVVEVFHVYTNDDGRGNEGELGEASNAQIAFEFDGNKNEEQAIDAILRNGRYAGEERNFKYKERFQK